MRLRKRAKAALVAALIVIALVIGAVMIESGRRYDPRQEINRLKATRFDSFFGGARLTWREDSLGGALFQEAPGYLGGGTLQAENREIGIAVFKSGRGALAAVQSRRSNVALPIAKGQRARNGVSTWWFARESALLCIVHRNMVFEARSPGERHSEVERELWHAAGTFLGLPEAPSPTATGNPLR